MVIRGLAALLLLSFTGTSLAERPVPSEFKARSLGEAAAIANDLSKPITLELEVPLGGEVWDLEPLVKYLREQGFSVEARVSVPAGKDEAQKMLALLARKHATLTVESITGYSNEVRVLIPKGLQVKWQFARQRGGS